MLSKSLVLRIRKTLEILKVKTLKNTFDNILEENTIKLKGGTVQLSIITCISIHTHLNALTDFEFSNLTIFDKNICLKNC